ncbi:MAG TPA: sulfatase-like hydrolase/transferase [Candidatus Saccharimonadales bacterium]|nr:sulfatase-like hydrolase/transferase [Candidatus Saccharimonadales bacterium]
MASGGSKGKRRKGGRGGGAPPAAAKKPAGSGSRRLLLLGGGFLAIVVVLSAWLWFGSASTTFRGNTSAYNVLLVTMDTTRADRLGCYGYSGVRTPIIDGVADRGVLFENAYTPAVMTLPAHASIMSGEIPPVHGVRINGSALLKPEVETLAEMLKAAGLKTGAAVSAVVLDSMFGLDQGFDSYDDNLPESGPHDVYFAQRPASAVTDAALAWLNTARAGRWFFWAHYFDPHSPWNAPSPFSEQYGQHSYEGEIAYMDSEIGRLLAGIDEMGVRDRTIVILVGDHGEGLRDHGEMSHGVFIYNETARVPLIISVPGFVNGPRRVPGVVRTTDILPTILDLLRLPGRPNLQGVSLWPLLSGAKDDMNLAAYSESAGSALMYGWSPLAALREGSWKYIQGTKPELYNMKEDPGERNNLIATDSAEAGKLREELRGMLTSLTPVKGDGSVSLSPDQEAKLRSLGYTGGTEGKFRAELESDPAAIMAGASYGLVDPKDKVDALEMINKISSAYGSGDFRTAAGLAREYLAGEPDNTSVRQFLADSYRGLGMYDEALSEYRTILGVSPDDVDVLLNVGWVLSKQGDAQQAMATYEKVLKIHPKHIFALSSLGNLHFLQGDLPGAAKYYRQVLLEKPNHWKTIVAMAEIFQRQGMSHEAKVFLQRAIEIKPKDLDSYLSLGWLQFTDKEYDDALKTLDTAEKNFPTTPEIDISRGDVLVALNRIDEAETSYQKGLREAPRAAQGYHGLARVAEARGRKDEAVKYLQQALEMNPDDKAARQDLARLGSGGS